MKPATKPQSPNFSSGPCKKRPGHSLSNLPTDILGRSHRSSLGKERLKLAIDKTKELLKIPADYRVGIVPASDTGAMEMAMWSMLGERPVDVCYWESFGKGWMNDITNQLKLDNVRKFEANYGQLPNLADTDSSHDIIFTYNGTTSGVKVADTDWISDNREGLTFCDATSAVFAMDMPWQKLDVTTYSWQKVLGGEAAHGMLILSPAAVKRLESYTPNWPLPKIFRMTTKGQFTEAIFTGATINTPSMLCVEDYIDALNWVENIGGLSTVIKRSEDNLAVIAEFVEHNDWINFLAESAETCSNTSICLMLNLETEKIKAMTKLLAEENVALDINSYKDAPAGIRIWGGATVETSDIRELMPWLTWAYHSVTN